MIEITSAVIAAHPDELTAWADANGISISAPLTVAGDRIEHGDVVTPLAWPLPWRVLAEIGQDGAGNRPESALERLAGTPECPAEGPGERRGSEGA